MNALPHFTIDSDLISLMSKEEVCATLQALQTCGLLRLPYPDFTLRFSGTAYALSPGWVSDYDVATDEGRLGEVPEIFYTCRIAQQLTIKPDNTIYVGVGNFLSMEASNGAQAEVDFAAFTAASGHGVTMVPRDGLEQLQGMVINMGALLVAALNTKNVESQTSLNKRAARGIGNGKFRTGQIVHLSVTRLSVPRSISDGTGRHVKLHWRRGHVHRWRKGDGSLVAKYLPAMVVNLARGGAVPPQPEYEVAP